MRPQASVADDDAAWLDPPSSSSCESSEEVTPGAEFVAHMTTLLNERVLNARQFCEAMWFAGRAGIPEAVPWGMNPGAASGHYQRKLNAATGDAHDRADLYMLSVPGHAKHDLSRTRHSVPTLPPHEQIEGELVDPTYRNRLRDAVANNELPPAYWAHPMVRETPLGAPVGHPAPLALYLDAVPYSHTDSIIGFWLENILSTRRYLCCVLRKRTCCKCGCRGWCSFHAVFSFLAWSLGALARGVHPERRHDGNAWAPSDAKRELFSGVQMGTRAIVIYIKGDWAEYSNTLGLPAWTDSLRPCFQCVACGPEMHVPHGNSPVGLRWACNREEDYGQACARCEIQVPLTHANRDAIIEDGGLRYDKRADGSKGRALSRDLPALGLRANDRLEPSRWLVDVGQLADAEPVEGATLTFWRPSSETLARHRNPLFSAETGITPARCLTIDVLHCVHLGVMKVWCRIALWHLLSSSVYPSIGSADENLQRAILVMRAQLMAFYKAHRRDHGDVLTALSDLTLKMVGTPNDQKLKTKGAETFGLMLFLLHMYRVHADALGADGRRYFRAGDALRGILEVWTTSGRIVPATAQQERGLGTRCFRHKT